LQVGTVSPTEMNASWYSITYRNERRVCWMFSF